VTTPPSDTGTSYRLATALAARLIGRSLVTLSVLVGVATLVGVLAGGWVVPAVVAGLGIVLVTGWTWWLLRRGAAVLLTDAGYDVRLLQGVGVTRALWSEVADAVAATPRGEPCLVLHLVDGRTTRLPMAALAGDREAFAHDVRRRLRDAHGGRVAAETDAGAGANGADSAEAEDSL
jgi:hypothetical protein